MNLISPDEEDILSGILDEGINEIRQSNTYSASNKAQSIKKSDSYQTSNALRNVLNEIKNASSNNSNDANANFKDDSSNKNNNMINFKKDSNNKIKTDDMYDLKNEIKLLQNKINGLGKNIFNKKNSVSISRDNLSRINEESLIKSNNTNNLSQRKVKNNQNQSVSVLKNSKSNSCIISKKLRPNDKITNNKKIMSNVLVNSTSVKTLRKTESPDYKTYCHREVITGWKEKYHKLMKDDKIVAKMLQDEKNKHDELTKLYKNLEIKWKGYDKINHKYNKLIDEYEKLLIRYDESEMIRSEQSQLIKSLKNELKMLGKWTNLEDKENDNDDDYDE